EVPPRRRARDPVVDDRAEHGGDERERPGIRHPRRERDERRPHEDLALAVLLVDRERRDAREEPEEDVERLAVLEPRLASEGEHPRERDRRVDAERRAEIPRLRRVREDELHAREREEE